MTASLQLSLPVALKSHEGPADSTIIKIGSHENGNDSGNGDDSPEMSQRACRQHHNISNSHNNDNDDVNDTDGDYNDDNMLSSS